MTQSAASPFLVFDFSDDEGRGRRNCFREPSEIIVADSIDEVSAALRKVEREVESGRYAAGHVSYEAAPAFDPALVAHDAATAAMPLVWFGIFEKPSALEEKLEGQREESSFNLSDWTPAESRARYAQNVETIREAIARGETYQTNYTLRLRARFEGDAYAFYERLRAAQRAPFAAYLDTGRHRILSASPELFFRRLGAHLTTRPMKGTVRRGRWLEEDESLSRWLAGSEKNRAENVMIVDLLRNDLGRIAETGSVRVESLFRIERYPTVFQMTSTVVARARAQTTLEEIFRALFPCGSVTGAPKVSTMRLIRRLELEPRGVYCGSIGFISPEGETVFNVAIRTVVINSLTGVAEYGVGGGITWGSTADDEYAEILDKASFLAEAQAPFELLETLRLERGRYRLLEEHLRRLTDSARYFDAPLSVERVRAALDEHANQFPEETRRVRLLVSLAGQARIESEPLEEFSRGAPPVVALARTPVSKRERFLYHKTTRREIYEQRRAERPEAFDVLLCNEQDELTEFTNANLLVELDGRCWTPPVESGLLAGTLRAELIARGKIDERVLTREDLARASRVWWINSVRGCVEVRFEHESDASSRQGRE
ncbi:MAG TPA: aminodeoxychorismate synthase component I [Pyrinomonadaceae bacterium]|jgi:para-aminobenzoate synthetase/4-amino-4-deoxychorismate lyase